MLVPLVGLGCLIIMLVLSIIIGRFVKPDKRCLYLLGHYSFRKGSKNKLVRTEKEYFIL